MISARLDSSNLLDGFAATTMAAAVAFALRTAGMAPLLAASAAICVLAVTFVALRQVDARPRPRKGKFAIHPLAFEQSPPEAGEQPESDSALVPAKDAAEELRDALHELRRAIR